MPIPGKRKYQILFLLLFGFLMGKAQRPGQTDSTVLPQPADSTHASSTPLLLNAIIITGNHKTRSNTIERELPFKKGDTLTLSQLVSMFQRTRELLINTRLFNNVIVSIKAFHGYQVDVEIDVSERWYIFPVPYFRPVDRNLSAWADKNYSLSRVNYGLKFLYNNFTGRNDRLRMWLITGYTRQVQLNYDQPYADRTLRHGYGFGVYYAALKEVNSSTDNNRQTFINTENVAAAGKYMVRQWAATVSYSYRPALTVKHAVRFSLNSISTDSVVAAINPKYFSNGVSRVLYPELSYAVEYQKVDYVAYVLRGFMGDLNFTKRGISSNMNLWQLTGRFTTGLPLGHGFSAGIQGWGAVKLPLDQPYFNQRMLGYGDIYLRGLEQYVIDGVAGSMLRTTLRKKLFGFMVSGGRIPTLERIPFTFYAKIFGDAGYVYNRSATENSLVNKMLYTSGAGIDVVSLYDFVLRCEYSFNQLGQSGFFFHIRNDF